MAITMGDIKKLGFNFFNIDIYRYGCEEVCESITIGCDIDGIINGMDTIWLLGNAVDDWSNYWATIDYEGVELICMKNLSTAEYELFDVDENVLNDPARRSAFYGCA